MLPIAPDSTAASGSREQANRLVSSMASRMRAGDIKLDDKDDAAFGGVGFHFLPSAGKLAVRVFIEKAFLDDDPEPVRENYRKVARALNDPKIGGMFEHDGATFVLDEKASKYFLVREFPVARTEPRPFCEEVNDLMNLGATWTMRWFRRVARITHGKEPPPTAPVTRQHPE